MKHPDAITLERALARLACPTTKHAAIIMAERDDLGLTVYGKNVDENPISASEWARHALEECADGLKYAIRAREEARNMEMEVQALRTANVALVERVSKTQAALDVSALQLLEALNDRNSLGVQLDLLRDELMRIRARIGETGLIEEHPELSSIANYCERAQNDIAVRYTPIQERDRLEREVMKLVERVKRLEEVGQELRKASHVFYLPEVDLWDQDETSMPIDKVDPLMTVVWEDPPSAGEHVRLLNAINGWLKAISQP